ncbi:MAG TPA: hypothetical protein DCL77_08770 [Prolixibacteraceae bacterium]|jgi:hypothetical protein|nr:hypothetical protein [Prolixibacteraceae bacterium]
MKTTTFYLIGALLMLLYSGCNTEGPIGPEGPQGPAGQNGQNATVFYSEWFSPSSWSGSSGDWYFDASAPDLTQDIVEQGVVLAYVWLAGDLYSATTVRPLPAFAVGANWDFLIHQYGSIEFTSDMSTQPLTSGNKFRFVAIPGTTPALKSASLKYKSEQELRNMTYQEVCKLFNIPE